MESDASTEDSSLLEPDSEPEYEPDSGEPDTQVDTAPGCTKMRCTDLMIYQPQDKRKRKKYMVQVNILVKGISQPSMV